MSRNTPLYRKPWWDLSPEEQHRRQVDLWVLDKVRRGKMSLKEASKEQGVSPKAVIRHTNAFRKQGSRWVAKRSDRISTARDVFMDGKIVTIVVNDSRQRSKIGMYDSAVAQLYYRGNREPLLKLKGLTVTDSEGNKYALDTDPESVLEILRRLEGAEFEGPYQI